MFSSEKEMQKWLEKALEDSGGLADLISEENIDEFEGIETSNPFEKKVLDSFQLCLKSLYINDVITADENFSMKEGEILRPDFLLYACETQSMVIVELKNISGPTRQVGTEVSAYANEVRSYLPFIADGDIVNVIISTEWPTLLRHYIAHEIYWLHRNIICFEPIKVGNDIFLNIKELSSFVDDEIILKVGKESFGGYQLCLYDYDRKEGVVESTLDNHLEQMKAALSAMAVKGNALKSHGFAILWKDNLEISRAPYSITLLNVAPFQAIGQFLLYLEEGESPSNMQERFIRLVQEHDPQGHSQTLSEIYHYGQSFLDDICSPAVEGFSTWSIHADIIAERGDLISFCSWGAIGEQFFDSLHREYKNGNSKIRADCPNVGLGVIDYLIDPDYVDVPLTLLGEA